MKTSIKYFIIFLLFTTIYACSQKTELELDNGIVRDPNELPTQLDVSVYWWQSKSGYTFKFKPFYTAGKYIDSLAPIDDYDVGYKYTYNAKGKPLKLRMSDHGTHPSYTDIVFTYNAEGTQWLSRRSTSAEREDWYNAKYNAQGQRASLDYCTMQNNTDTLYKGTRNFQYDEKGNVTWINFTNRKAWNKTYKYWDDQAGEYWVKYEYNREGIGYANETKTEQFKRFEESFVFAEHRPVDYWGQSFGPDLPGRYYLGNYQNAFTFIYETIRPQVGSWGAVRQYGKNSYSNTNGGDWFLLKFDYNAIAPK